MKALIERVENKDNNEIDLEKLLTELIHEGADLGILYKMIKDTSN